MTVRLTGLMFAASAGRPWGRRGSRRCFHNFGVQYLPYMSCHQDS